MKKHLFSSLLGILTLLSSFNIQAQTQYTINFEKDSLQVLEKPYEDGNSYNTLKYNKCTIERKEGSPSILYRYLQFIVPDEVTDYTIEINSLITEEFSLTHKLLPVQPLVQLSIYATALPFISPDSSIYNSEKAYPSEIIKIVNDGYFDGDKRILTLRIAPIQYLGIKNKIIWNKSVNFTIHPALNRSASTRQLNPIHRIRTNNEQELIEELNFVENKQDISHCTANLNNSVRTQTTASTISLPAYEYTIIASSIFVPGLERLIFWKKLRGMTAGVVTIESILNNPAITGDKISGIYDDAGKLREYLTYAYQQGTKYVFLIGKNIPYRYGLGKYTSEWEHIIVQESIPTDLYFSDLNGNWNVDKDEFYGEYEGDRVDCLPELYIGRITCKNNTELNNYLSKLLRYETNPGYGEHSYLRRALYTQADQLQSGNYANIFSGEMMINFTKAEIFEELPSHKALSPTFPKGKDLVNEMNKHYGFIANYNHGYDFGLALTTKGIAVESINGLTFQDNYQASYTENETGNGVDCLTNEGYPFIVYSLACTTMPFDKLTDIPYNLGEAFTIMGKYGAAAYLGNTRNGISPCNFDINFAGIMKTWGNKIGKSDALSKVITDSITHYNALSHNLLGCPAFNMWANTLHKITNIQITPTENGMTIQSTNEPTLATVIGLFSGENYLQYQRNIFDHRFYNLPRNYIITLKGGNSLLTVAPVYLQNENVTGKYNLFYLENVTIGNHVDDKKAPGDFILKNGADLSIEYSGEVTLENGFEVEVGASFELKPSEK